MTQIKELSREALLEERDLLRKRYEDCKNQKLNLDMTRGKPCNEQLDAVSDLMNILKKDDFKAENGMDCRNYGLPYGIPEAKALFADLLGTTSDHVIVGNASSLNIMYDVLVRAMLLGEVDSDRPWCTEPVRKWICPVPGYDRHFLVTETLGFELISVPIHEDGPDMDIIERLVSEDSTIKGMWGIPLYSNPDGYIYSESVCRRLASMKTAAKDFRILWDNAYVAHHLYEDKKGSIPDILRLCEEAGNPNRVYEFASTSKITYAGAGISCLAANAENRAYTEKNISIQTIGPDKMNQLRHVRYLRDKNGVSKVMKRHAEIIRPKFDAAESVLSEELGTWDIARWNKPLGGYFLSLFVYPGTAKKIVSLAKEAGVAFTPAGATYPYGKDPKDENIRIAPTFPAIEDVKKAVGVLCVCAKLAAIELVLEEIKL